MGCSISEKDPLFSMGMRLIEAGSFQESLTRQAAVSHQFDCLFVREAREGGKIGEIELYDHLQFCYFRSSLTSQQSLCNSQDGVFQLLVIHSGTNIS